MRRKRRLAIWAVTALLTLNVVLFLTQPGLALPNSLANYFFGPKMVRAEVIVKDGGTLHDYRVDQGRIRALAPDSITLLERDGTVVAIPVAVGADIQSNGRPVSLDRLRRGMWAMTVRDGDAPATTVRARRLP